MFKWVDFVNLFYLIKILITLIWYNGVFIRVISEIIIIICYTMLQVMADQHTYTYICSSISK